MPNVIFQARSSRVLVPLATMLVAGAVVAGSGATFSSATSSAPNVVTAGDFTQTNNKSGQAIFTAPTMKPGDTTFGTATVTNTGDFAGTFTLDESSASNTFTPGTLDLVVLDVTDSENPVPVYDGTIGDLDSVALGTVAVDESRTYKFTVTLVSGATNTEQLKSAAATYSWNAVQAV